jgi:IS1 family transposase
MLNHPIRLLSGSLHFGKLGLYCPQRAPCVQYAKDRNGNQDAIQAPSYPIHPIFRNVGVNIEWLSRRYGYWAVALFLFGSFFLGVWGGIRIDDHGSPDLWGRLLVATAVIFWLFALVSGLVGRLPWDWWNDNQQEKTYRRYNLHINIVTQKPLDTSLFMYYDNYMANNLPIEKQVAIIGNLCEGSSIRAIERMTGVHRDTIMRLGVKVGQGCTALMDSRMQDLSCDRLEMDEIWGFVGKKDRNVREGDDTHVGSVWTFCAIDADTKLVPAFKVGKRTNETANAFVQDVADRMRNRVQISTDGLKAYVGAMESAFGGSVDYAQIIKTYGQDEASNNSRRYSPPQFVSCDKRVISGDPECDLISTSYVERLNATTRLHMRRLTRLTLAFSKKWENFEAAVGLHFAYYNFVKRHSTVRATPAMAAGVAPRQWSVADLVEASV